jgi:Diphosphomevalonate decarboxylase-like N-terminal domain
MHISSGDVSNKRFHNVLSSCRALARDLYDDNGNLMVPKFVFVCVCVCVCVCMYVCVCVYTVYVCGVCFCSVQRVDVFRHMGLKIYEFSLSLSVCLSFFLAHGLTSFHLFETRAYLRMRREAWHNYKVRIVSENNFPTAAGLASSASGFCCLGTLLFPV